MPIPLFDENGTREGFLRDEDGSVVTTRVGEATLGALARDAGATVVQAGPGSTEFDDFVDRVARGEGEEIDAMQVTRFEEQYQIFLALALLMLVAAVLLPDRRRVQQVWTGRFE